MSPRYIGITSVLVVLLATPSAARSQNNVLDTFTTAHQLYQARHYSRAIPLLEEITRDHLQHRVAPDAILLLLDALNRTHQYERFESWIERLVTNKALMARSSRLARVLTYSHELVMRKRAEQHEKGGRYDECATEYMSLYRSAPKARRADELLYNAAVCFERGHNMGSSIKALTLLMTRYPKSLSTRRAYLRLGALWARLAQFDKAAKQYAAHARIYRADRAARRSLILAMRYTQAIGQHAQVVVLAKTFLRLYRRARHAPRIAYSIADTYRRWGKRDQELAALRHYLKRWSQKDRSGRAVAAAARVGEILWHRSCSRPRASDGACLTFRRPSAFGQSAAPRQCSGRIKVVLHRRKPRLVAAAMSTFRRAIKLYKRRQSNKTAPLARAAYTRARFFLAQPQVEQLLLAHVDGQRVTNVMRTLAAAQDGWPASVYQIGQLHEVLYCNGANAHHKAMLDAYGRCALAAATSAGGAHWSTVCHRALRYWQPTRYPTVAEHHGVASAVGRIVTVELPVFNAAQTRVGK